MARDEGQRVDLDRSKGWLTSAEKYSNLDGTAKEAHKFIDKIAVAFAVLERATVQDVAQLYGHLFYGSRVLQIPLAQFYHSIKFYARRSAAWQREELNGAQPAKIWPSIIPQLREWIAVLMENKPVTPLKRRLHSQEVIMFADASDTRWGGIVICDGEVVCRRGRFRDAAKLRINIKETLAVRNMLRDSKVDLRGRSLRIVVDNVTAKATMRRGYSKSFNLNLAAQKVIEALNEVGVKDFRIGYIKSALNPADKPSRGEDYDSSELDAALATIQQLPSEWGLGTWSLFWEFLP